MNTVVVQLQNKNKKEESIGPLQLNSSSDSKTLCNLLNTMLSNNSIYVFYYKNERIKSNLEELISKYDLNKEDVLNIDYVDEDDIKADYLLKCDDTIIDLAVFNGELYYLTYSGEIFKKDSNTKLGNLKVKGIVSFNSLFAYDDYCLFDIISNKELCKFDSAIRCISVDIKSKSMAIATKEKIYYQQNIDYSAEKDFLSDFKTVECANPRGICVHKGKLKWLEKYNQLVEFDINLEIKTEFYSKYTINRIHPHDSGVFGTTLNNRLLNIVNNLEYEYDCDNRALNLLIDYNNRLIYTTQHHIVILDMESMEERSFLKVDGQINSICILNDMLYIANDEMITGFILK